MTITNTITTLAAIGTAVNAADVTTPDNELLIMINDLINGLGDTEAILFDQITTPAAPAATKWKLYFTTTGPKVENSAGSEISINGVLPSRFEARATLTSGLPITTADVTAATSIKLTPFKGNRISLYDGSSWAEYTLSEISLSLSGLAANTNFDIFVYVTAGVLTLESVAWTNATTRATALTTQDGVYVKNGTLTKRYVGTFRTTSTIGQCEDSFTKRFLWNYYNRAARVLRVKDTTDSWTYATASYASLNASVANRLEFVRGLAEDPVDLAFVCVMSQTGSVAGSIGIGLGSTTVNSAFVFTYGIPSFASLLNACYKDTPALGYNYLQLLQYASGATVTFYGDVGVAYVQTGAVGELAA